MGRLRLALCAPLAAAWLAGCSAGPRPTTTVYQNVPTPVPVACIPADFPPAGSYETAESLRGVRGPELFRRLWVDWLKRTERMNLTEPAVQHCAQAAAPGPLRIGEKVP